MALYPQWLFLGLGAIAFLPQPCLGSSSHSLKYFYTAVSQPGQGLPQFITVGYLDDQLFIHYDSDTRQKLPRAPWMKALLEEDPRYLVRNTAIAQSNELVFRDALAKLRGRYNQSGGLHTLQNMYGCELSKDGHRGGYDQYSYDGRDFLSFDKETLTWTATDVPAQVTKRKWGAEFADNEYQKAYLEGACIEWLQKYLDYGKETLLRKEPPTVKVARKAAYDNMETLVCRAHGFYPKEIDINWKKDGEVWMQDTFRGGVAPNSDGTYHTWHSIKIDSKDRDRYRCHIEHDGLLEPLDLAWEESASDQESDRFSRESSSVGV
ncbi:patr class I histocompatibility antigen, B-2 alpha chain-like isoform X2 [Hemicordylus capensis]|uniref:patr class I histocompatibility antigen, B-2 alpha chain-like isoform X2 n=1 Tax=Hemicordylus capensis TaxID=884348 RepID=UPI0023031898|nr:patr class I histocompatibility antigen, B-2 alpha chain-like isoform X2 [Hemicordylus capensis]